MNTLEIASILKNEVCFLGVYPIDKIPKIKKYPAALIINTDKSTQDGEHWVSMYFNKQKECLFFDSYGMNPTYFNLDNYLYQNCTKWTWNSKQLQSFNSKTCGFYCCLFVQYMCRNFKLNQFLSKFTNDFTFNDQIVNFLFK